MHHDLPWSIVPEVTEQAEYETTVATFPAAL
jgi:hypothetical protein